MAKITLFNYIQIIFSFSGSISAVENYKFNA